MSMNNNIVGMNAMGGPVGGGMPMMNNGAPAGVRQQQPMGVNENQRSQLNTYIYEYFLKYEMHDCARALLSSGEPVNVIKDSPSRRRDDNSNSMGNGAGDDGADVDSKDDVETKRPSDLPLPNLPKECPESCFLYEWWCLFWDMFNARRGKGERPEILQYVTHTQHQSRMNQERQQAVLRGMRGDMLSQYPQIMMSRQNGMNMNPNELRRGALANQRNATPQQMQMMGQQQQKQQPMQRDPSDSNNQQRPQSPGSAENAPSPSKRPRLDGAPFNQQQMPNGRVQGQGMPQQVGHTDPSDAIQAAHLQLVNGVDRTNVTTQQFQNMPGSANANAQARSLTSYQAGLAQQQANQMPMNKIPNQGGPQNQGSPMMTQGPDNGAIANYYNPGEMGPNGMRGGPGGQPGNGGNHALQDYQMQLMLLEQQNKKRLMMARQEQDSLTARPDGSGPPGAMVPNGPPFQGTSPQGARSVDSPNPAEQMKRAAAHMNAGGMASPLPEGQSRGSPSGMNFNMPGGAMDANMASQFYKMNGMDPNMVAAGMTNGMASGMRPPSSHPAGFAGQMTPQQQQQQMALARQHQQQQQQAQNWQAGPNGQMMPQQAQAPAQQPTMGTPQQRAMPPPSAPVAGTTANGRTQPPSPQQSAAPPTPQQANKAAPKKKAESKDSKTKRATKKGSAANLNSGATPSADAAQEPATPTPATPITPVHPKSFNNNANNGQNGTAQPLTNGQQPGPAVNNNANMNNTQQPDALQGGFSMGDPMSFDLQTLEFGNPTMGDTVLQDFDFDSFLHQDEGVDASGFDAFGFMDGNEIGAEGP